MIREPSEKPRFIAVGIHAPHYPLRAPDAYFRQYPADAVKLPVNPPDDLDDVPYTFGHIHLDDGRILSEREQREFTAAYYACLTFADACVGVLLDALAESGRDRDTIICLWGDHGMQFGEHFMWRKHTFFEGSTRVPLIFALPGDTRGAQHCDAPVELIDLYPTLADLCGLPYPPGLEATSMKRLLDHPRGNWKTAAFTFLRDGISIHTGRYRYSEYGGPDRAELYDLRVDPGEFNNLATHPDHRDTVARLSRLLNAGWKASLL